MSQYNSNQVKSFIESFFLFLKIQNFQWLRIKNIKYECNFLLVISKGCSKMYSKFSMKIFQHLKFLMTVWLIGMSWRRGHSHVFTRCCPSIRLCNRARCEFWRRRWSRLRGATRWTDHFSSLANHNYDIDRCCLWKTRPFVRFQTIG